VPHGNLPSPRSCVGPLSNRLIALDEIGAVRLGDKVATYKADRTAIAQVIEARVSHNVIKAYTGELDGDTVMLVFY